MSAGQEMSGNEPTPDLDDVQQQEPEECTGPPVPVVIEGPVRILTLPTRTASMRSINVTTAETICGEDSRRASVTLYAATTGPAGFYVGTDRQMVTGGNAAYFDSGRVIVLHTTERLYARSVDTGTACQLSVVQELWAD